MLNADEPAALRTDKLFVGNLPFGIKTRELEALFSPYGVVSGVNLREDRTTGKQRGFGFVTFGDPADASRALDALQGRAVLGGRDLTVSWATERGGGASAVEADWVTVSQKPKGKRKPGKKRRGGGGGGKSWTTWASPTQAMLNSQEDARRKAADRDSRAREALETRVQQRRTEEGLS